MVDRLNAWARKVPTWVIYVLGVVPFVLLVVQAVTGSLGIDPVKEMEHQLGKIALQFLVAGLCVTPLRRYLGVNLLKFRRAIGLLAFLYVSLHLLVWLVVDVQILSQVWADIIKRPYITVGMGAFALMIPLAITSTNGWIRRLGRRWRQLHKLVYGAALLGGLHYILLAKGLQLEPLLYTGGVVVLLLLRFRLPPRFRTASA